MNKQDRSKLNTRSSFNKIFIFVLAWIFILIALFGLYRNYTGWPKIYFTNSFLKMFFTNNVLLLNALIWGIVGIIKQSQSEKSAQILIKYDELINNKQVTSISDIAKYVERPDQLVINDIKKMIKDRSIIAVTIDYEKNQIIYKSAATDQNSYSETNKHLQDDNVVICKSCGAKNILVPGKVNICEYCGSTLDKT